MDVTGCNGGVAGVTGMKGLAELTGVSKDGNEGKGDRKREGKISTDGRTGVSKVVQEIFVDLKRYLSLRQRPKNLGGMVELPSRKFLRVRKVFTRNS